jgi:hypothetical protein
LEVLALPGHLYGHIGLWHKGERIALVIDAVLENGIRDRPGTCSSRRGSTTCPATGARSRHCMRFSPERLLTAHYPLTDRAETAEFLDICDAFCDDAVSVMRSVAAGADPTLVMSWQHSTSKSAYPKFAAELGQSHAARSPPSEPGSDDGRAVAAFVASGTRCTSQTFMSAWMSGSWECAVSVSRRKTTSLTNPAATIEPISVMRQ